MKHPILSSLALAFALCTGSALAPTPAQARGGVVVYVPVAPPPLRVERVPPPRAGYVWVDGSWGWSRGAYHWNRGHWMHARHGYRYVAPRWVQDRRGWHRVDGRWGR